MIEDLNWRYATKKYDSSKIIPEEQLHILKEAIRLTPTSYGLQPFKVFVVQAPEIRKALREKSWNQTQITDASHLFVFAAQNTIDDKHIDEYMALTTEVRQLKSGTLDNYSNFVKDTVSKINPEEMRNWNDKQTYIALGMLLATAASLRIDATPIEGLETEEYDAILGLKKHHTVFVVALGYRATDDNMQFEKKVRKSKEQLFKKII